MIYIGHLAHWNRQKNLISTWYQSKARVKVRFLPAAAATLPIFFLCSLCSGSSALKFSCTSFLYAKPLLPVLPCRRIRALHRQPPGRPSRLLHVEAAPPKCLNSDLAPFCIATTPGPAPPDVANCACEAEEHSSLLYFYLEPLASPDSTNSYGSSSGFTPASAICVEPKALASLRLPYLQLRLLW